MEKTQRKEKERIRLRNSMKERYHIFRAKGRCYKCGEEPGINPNTGKNYMLCWIHRIKESEKRKRRVIKRAGMVHG